MLGSHCIQNFFGFGCVHVQLYWTERSILADCHILQGTFVVTQTFGGFSQYEIYLSKVEAR